MFLLGIDDNSISGTEDSSLHQDHQKITYDSLIPFNKSDLYSYWEENPFLLYGNVSISAEKKMLKIIYSFMILWLVLCSKYMVINDYNTTHKPVNIIKKKEKGVLG